MSETMYSSVPSMRWGGTKDLSGGRSVRAPEAMPFHRPLMFFFSAKGPLEATFESASMFKSIYGSEALDVSSPFATIATPFLNVAVKAQNRFLAVRLRPEDAPDPSANGLSIDILKTQVDTYERNQDGSFKLDQNGAKIPTGTKVPGIIARLVVEKIEDQPAEVGGRKFGARTTKPGTLGSEGEGQSTIYPLTDFMATDFGSDGDNLGWRIWAPTTKSRQAADEDLYIETKSYPYRLQIMKRRDKQSSPSYVPNTYDESSVTFSFGKDVVSEQRGGMVLDLDELIPGRWETNDKIEVRSPFVKPHVYRENLELVLTEIGKVLATEAPELGKAENLHMINFVGGTDIDGRAYDAYQLVSPLQGGVSLSENATYYLQDGGDGTMDFASFDSLVRKIAETKRVNGQDLSRQARYPFNAVWDFGYSLDTKLELNNFLDLPTGWVATSTQDVSKKPADSVTEDSIGMSLLTRIQQHTDSIDFNTPPYRGMVVARCGYWTGSKRRVLVPALLHYFERFCEYAGADDGTLNSDKAFDEDEHKIITSVYDLNNMDQGFIDKRRQWNLGLNYPEDWDTARQFFAAAQSFYPDQTSTLRSAFVGLIVTNIARYCFETWRALVGNQKLTRQQLMERSDKAITAKTANRLDGRADVIPHSTITEGDAERGYSWTCPIDLRANGMPTVMDAYVINYRREDLQ